MSLRVLAPGLLTTVQDLGRTGTQRDGIPAGGAMDAFALRIGNMLIGNPEQAAALEATLLGPTLEFGAPALIAIAGADLDATLDGHAIPPWYAVSAPAGATLRFGRARTGCRAYLCVAGGIDVPPVFGSRSTYLRGGFGGLDGRALRVGDVVPIGTPTDASIAMLHALDARRIQRTQTGASAADRIVAARWTVSGVLRPAYSTEPILRLVAGAQLDALTDDARRSLEDTVFRVSTSADRMGFRLDGPPLAIRRPLELLSEGVAMGTVQLPPGGAPILLMADRQTTGGYPRLGEVATVDLPLAAQLKPGDQLRFRVTSLAEAQALWLDRERQLAEARAALALRAAHSTTGY